MIKKRKNKYASIVLQRKVMFASFGFFAIIFEKNKTMPKTLINYYQRLGHITKGYEKYMSKDWEDINRVVLRYENQQKKKELSEKEMEIDYLLTSVSILATYYDLTNKGIKRWFYPMTYEQILDIQDEIIEDLEEKDLGYMVTQTFDFTDYLVKKIFQLEIKE